MTGSAGGPTPMEIGATETPIRASLHEMLAAVKEVERRSKGMETQINRISARLGSLEPGAGMASNEPPLQSSSRPNWSKERRCYTCGRLGHFAKDCTASKN